MKRIFYFIVFSIILCSCETKTVDNANVVGVVDVETVNKAKVDHITNFEFEGHEYIDFVYWVSNGYSAHMEHSVVHDPNCKYCNH